MTARRLVLSDAAAAAALPKAREYSIGHVKLPGLALRVLPGGGSPDPVRFRSSGLTFEAFTKVYRKRRARYWKPSTLEAHDSYLQSTLLPFFGAMPLESIATTDVVRWFHDYGADRLGGANRALDVLRGMFNWTKTWKMVPTISINPCRGITRYRRPPRGRLLNQDDCSALAACWSATP